MDNSNKRNYYIDIIRGIAFFLMAIDHLIYDVAELFGVYWRRSFTQGHLLYDLSILARSYRATDASIYLRFFLISSVFIFISGVSSNLSKNVFKRGLRLFVISLILTISTIVAYYIFASSGTKLNIIIYFGILHCISIGLLLTPIFKKFNRYILFVIALIIFGLGIYFENVYANTLFLIPFNITPTNFATADFYPILPHLAAYILGFIFGDWYFNFKKMPKATKTYKVNMFTYFGKNTLVWYFVHQVLLVVLLAIITFLALAFI